MKTSVLGYQGDVFLLDWAASAGLNFSRLLIGSVCIFESSNEAKLRTEDVEWLEARGYRRVFEGFYIPADAASGGRHTMVRALFTSLPPADYLATIEKTKNVGCYEFLFGEAQSNLLDEPRTRVLDVGCGPGTLMDSSVTKQASIVVGFDFIEASLSAARNRGLEALDEVALGRLRPGTFDVLLSCYVLHYESLTPSNFELVLRLLRVGGVWAANFHKGRGVKWFLDCIDATKMFDVVEGLSPFGTVLFVRKRSKPAGSEL